MRLYLQLISLAYIVNYFGRCVYEKFCMIFLNINISILLFCNIDVMMHFRK